MPRGVSVGKNSLHRSFEYMTCEALPAKKDVVFAKATECKKICIINVRHVAATLFCVHLLVLNNITQLENINLHKL